MYFIEIMTVTLGVLYLGYVVFERLYFIKIRKSFKHVIHVNGTRGKSTTARLIDAGLRECGYRVFSKTTGTIPTMINTSNQEVEIKRYGLANIREQYKMMAKAYREKAEILVIECMAVNPELQYLTQHRMLNADITIITNVLLDHIGDMGSNRDEIADALANTIPRQGYLVIADEEYYKKYSRRIGNDEVKIVVAEDKFHEDQLATYKNNLNLAWAITDILSLDKDRYLKGMKKYYRDPGAFKIFRLENTVFLNAFSVNDPTSTYKVYQDVIQKFTADKITILLNTRNDRPTRTIQSLHLLGDLTFKKLLICGSNKPYVKRFIRKHYPKMVVEEVKKIEDLQKEEVIFGIGNLQGMGLKILQYFEKNGVQYDD